MFTQTKKATKRFEEKLYKSLCSLYNRIFAMGSIEVPLRIAVPSVWASLLLFF